MNAVTVRIAETLGAEKALELLYCTEDLEEAGGLMILVSSYKKHFSEFDKHNCHSISGSSF